MWFRRQRVVEEESAPPEASVDEFIGDEGSRILRDALTARNWTIARELLSTAPTSEHYSRRVIVAADVAGLEAWIDGPIRDEPAATLPLLVKGARFVYWAWEARGSGIAKTVANDTWKIWFDRLRQAEDCLDEVVAREPGNAEAWHWLIVLGRARQVSKEDRMRRFSGLIDADLTHFYGHLQMLEGLKAKWSGSAEEMFDFARSTAAKHPGTQLPVLIADAHLQHRWDNGGDEYMERKEVGDELVAAAQQSIWHPSYRPSLLTTVVLNTFAFAFARADRFVEAERCFADLGDHRVTPRPWNEHDDDSAVAFVQLRDYVRDRLK